MRPSLWFLASPYRRYVGGLDAAHRVACEAAAGLMRAGINVFSPISHSHSIAMLGGLDPHDDDLWMRQNRPAMEMACGMIELRATSWELSAGMAAERAWFLAEGRPVISMLPGVVPFLPSV